MRPAMDIYHIKAAQGKLIEQAQGGIIYALALMGASLS